MSLKKRGQFWWIDIRSPYSGQRVRQSTGTGDKTLAKEYLDKIAAELWRQDKLGEKPKRQWTEAATRWLKESSHKASLADDKSHMRWLDRYLRDKTLDRISRPLIDAITEKRLAKGVSNATVNRTLEVLRAILNKAVNEWEWLDKAPKIRMLKEPRRRVRFLTLAEAKRLLAELPEHLSDMAAFSLHTGLRRNNVTRLTWEQVDLKERRLWIHPDQAKARKAIPVALNAEAVSIVAKWKGRHPTHVFCFRGKPITQVSTKAWYGAQTRAGISNFRWHDLRHTWASWHVQMGTPLYVLQEMGGWESPEMVQRYAHFSPEHLRPYADRLQPLREMAESEGPKA
jgi:integrase